MNETTELTELQQLYLNMLDSLKEGIDDMERFEQGNMSAGTRVRKNMQAIKELAQKIRIGVQEQKNAITN
jgi:hypothetical protein